MTRVTKQSQKRISIFIALMLLFSLISLPHSAAAGAHWADKAVRYLLREGAIETSEVLDALNAPIGGEDFAIMATQALNTPVEHSGNAFTRGDLATSITTALGLTGGNGDVFADQSAIPADALPSVLAMHANGFMRGYPDGSFGASKPSPSQRL